MSTVLGAHGYDGLRHPSLMPLHYYALLLLQSGIVSNGLSQAVKGVTVGAISGESAFECNYPHIGGENDGYCGGKTCLESVCGDCCFHLACHSYQYCCDRCTAGQKALLGMNERCLGVPAWQLFAVTCDDRFPGWAYCQKECGDGEEAAAAYGYWQGGGAGGDAGAMEKMDIQEHVDDNEPAAEAEYYNELLKKESAKIYANIGDQDYKGFKSMLT
uniref:Uncharacterized protein n=1 Tax=Heterosigma akashiwo TaxID=2829 RepID=A0A7S4DI76_HETAK